MRRIGTALRLLAFIWGSTAAFIMALAGMAADGQSFGLGLMQLALAYGVFSWGTDIRDKATGIRA